MATLRPRRCDNPAGTAGPSIDLVTVVAGTPTASNEAPQAAQNFAFAAFSAPHFMHFMATIFPLGFVMVYGMARFEINVVQLIPVSKYIRNVLEASDSMLTLRRSAEDRRIRKLNSLFFRLNRHYAKTRNRT